MQDESWKGAAGAGDASEAGGSRTGDDGGAEGTTWSPP